MGCGGDYGVFADGRYELNKAVMDLHDWLISDGRCCLRRNRKSPSAEWVAYSWFTVQGFRVGESTTGFGVQGSGNKKQIRMTEILKKNSLCEQTGFVHYYCF